MNGENFKKILVLSANPKGTTPLRLGEEIHEIKEGLQLAKQRDKFKIESVEAVRYRDIGRSILNYKPQIIHFCGHGAGEPGLIFEDVTGNQKLVDASALDGLFELFADTVECVVLNACYSEIQAKAIANHINYVIGMSKEIGDKAAIEFAVGFYDGLGAGEDIKFAYKYACSAIRIAGIPEDLTPQLLRKEDLCGVIINPPENNSPPEDTRQGTVVSPPPEPTPRTTVIPRQEETGITKYRQKVEEFATDGEISDIESHILDDLQKQLGLTDGKACEVREDVLVPYQIYKEQFTKKVAVAYPLGEKEEAELKKLQIYYKIQEEYVLILRQETETQQAKKLREQQEEAQRLERQQYENNLRLYEQELSKALKAGYPLDDYVRNGLKNYQQSLGLGDGDIAVIEQQLLAPKHAEYKRQQEAERLKKAQEQQETQKRRREQEKQTDDLSSKKGIDYTRLRDLLKAGEWKEADQETLAVMLKIADREKEGWLNIYSIEQFPCTDLRTIDQLWVRYSNGHFGFSVQKVIWQEVGKKMGCFLY